jgi:hypothetical protein
MARRREMPGASLSFLDVMCCGFGAVVLLVMILNGSVLEKRKHQFEDLRGELERAAALESIAQERVNQLAGEMSGLDQQQRQIAEQISQTTGRLDSSQRALQQAEGRSRALSTSIGNIEAQKDALQQSTSLLRAKTAEQWDGGKRPVGFSGDGRRQYLTGLELGANRTLILLDASASMLDESLVNIIRWKLMPPEARVNAPKWQRAVRSLHWLVANLRPGKQFQVYQFGTQARPLIPGTEGKWLSTDDAVVVNRSVSEARQLAPLGGTSLHAAFNAINQMSPRPDSIILITDGLPTQGVRPTSGLVTSDQRLLHFADAIKSAPRGIPINTILLPMEGDPLAAGMFWQLAILTKGSLLTPARDWP